MPNDELLNLYTWFYIPKMNGDYLKRNALIALANNPDSSTVDFIFELLKSESEIIRFYAIWAIWKLKKINDIAKYYDVRLERSQLVKDEYLRLIK
jgi:HEAT repeat protein